MAEFSVFTKPSFDELYEKYFDKVYKYVYTIVLHKENAEDIVADTFMSAYRNFDSFDPARASFVTWITRIAHNTAVNLVRSASFRYRADLPEDFELGGKDPELEKITEANETLLFLYEKLSSEEKEFLNLRYTMELKDSEVAEILGLNVKTVNKRYQRLLEKCRKILNQ